MFLCQVLHRPFHQVPRPDLHLELVHPPIKARLGLVNVPPLTQDLPRRGHHLGQDQSQGGGLSLVPGLHHMVGQLPIRILLHTIEILPHLDHQEHKRALQVILLVFLMSEVMVDTFTSY